MGKVFPQHLHGVYTVKCFAAAKFPLSSRQVFKYINSTLLRLGNSEKRSSPLCFFRRVVPITTIQGKGSSLLCGVVLAKAMK